MFEQHDDSQLLFEEFYLSKEEDLLNQIFPISNESSPFESLTEPPPAENKDSSTSTKSEIAPEDAAPKLDHLEEEPKAEVQDLQLLFTCKKECFCRLMALSRRRSYRRTKLADLN